MKLQGSLNKFKKGESYLILLCLPFILLTRLIRPFFLIRFGCLSTNGIGDMIAGFMDYKAKDSLGLFPKRRVDFFFTSQEKFICNEYLYEELIIKNKFRVHRIFYYFWRANLWFPDYKTHDAIQPNYSNWVAKNFSGFCTINETEQELQTAFSRALKISKHFVCFHSRDSEYKKHLQRNVKNFDREISHQAYRNSNFFRYASAARFLNEKGVDAVRVGQVVGLDNFKHVVSYSKSSIANSENDIKIFKSCLFWVMTNSGYTWAPQLLGKPGVACNLIPFTPTMLWHYPRNTMVFPKHFYSSVGAKLSPKAVLDQNVYNHDEFKYLNDLASKGIIFQENTEEEIESAVVEYFNYFQKNFENVDRVAQKRFWEMMCPQFADELTNHVILPKWYLEECYK